MALKPSRVITKYGRNTVTMVTQARAARGAHVTVGRVTFPRAVFKEELKKGVHHTELGLDRIRPRS